MTDTEGEWRAGQLANAGLRGKRGRGLGVGGASTARFDMKSPDGPRQGSARGQGGAGERRGQGDGVALTRSSSSSSREVGKRKALTLCIGNLCPAVGDLTWKNRREGVGALSVEDAADRLSRWRRGLAGQTGPRLDVVDGAARPLARPRRGRRRHNGGDESSRAAGQG